MHLQIIQEASHPGSPPLGVGPNPDVFVDALKNWSAEVQLRLDLMNSRGPLKVKCGVIFWHGMLAIRLFPHFDIAKWIATVLDVSNLGRGVIGCAVKQGDREHRRQIVGEPAVEEKIETGVLVSATVAYVLGGVPGIDGRNTICGSPLFGIFRRFDESATGINCASSNLLDGITDTVAYVIPCVLVAGVGGF